MGMKFEINKFKAYRGRACQFAILMVDEDGDPIPVEGLQTITALIQNEDGSYLEKAAAGGVTWGLGEKVTLYYFTFTAEETEVWKLGDNRAIFVRIGFTATTIMHEFNTFLDVAEELIAIGD